ncbi:MAG: hypothetical protein IPL59_21945 [Candidatus Competibacteraceae bacterium]|uniref:Secreted protein n=1 Tax=Candidatus Contendobacter odensis Run_B_J11 TaxID=1400861 RepID=A0A7U7J2Q6_9GAMM|nr:hypothetical protein [Candidatus Contendobacter odensis]MBK8537524.1 hypothetical protein [Candidatus Competibacteraceae bacterium]MBK8751492.1 hypothetical protein [Candidatus Competibacteraceae bacterium]CDH43563.1 exported hypothetical protein [Candidatus Contendobacter odensis Run_B_J11]
MIPWRTSLKLMFLIVVFSASATDINAPAIPPPTESNAAAVAAISRQMEVFSRDLEQLRLFMGVAKVSELDIGIRSDLPRDLYFQTLTLWQKTDRLMFEVVRTHSPAPSVPVGDIDMQDILPTLQQAHRLLRQIMGELKLAETTEMALVPLATDLFTAILNLNRQLDSLLERHFAPTDVYTEVTLAVGYAARLLAHYPDAIRIPAEPPFEPNKLPSDVYRRLIACLQSITRLFQALELPVLTVDIRQIDTTHLTPNDVFVVASLIVSQLDLLHKHLGIAKLPPQSIYPGLKFPAHSYQRAGILQAQLEQLECYASAHCSTPSGNIRHESDTPEK